MDIQNGLLDGTKPLSFMLTVRSNDIHLRSVSQNILHQQPLNLVAHLNIQFNLPGANELKINILQKKKKPKKPKGIYFYKVTSA